MAPYNRLCNIEDFAPDALGPLVREVFPEHALDPLFPVGAEHRKHWEIGLAVRTLRDLGALRPDARILGVGAGAERTSFHLTRFVREVVATDLYLKGGSWSIDAPPGIVVAPRSACQGGFDPAHFTPRHMDARALDFPDESFDGVFSSSSIEHFGTDADIAAAAYEMGRVLRPGGVLTLSTEYLLRGAPGFSGWPFCRIFSAEALQRLVVEASGLEPVDALDLGISEATLASPRELGPADARRRAGLGFELPHLVLVNDGQYFTSVHLALRKTATWPRVDNGWARPSEALRETIRREAEETAVRLEELLSLQPEPPASGDGALEMAFREWDETRARYALAGDAAGSGIGRVFGFLRRTAGRVRDLGRLQDRERALFLGLLRRSGELERRVVRLETRGGGPYRGMK